MTDRTPKLYVFPHAGGSAEYYVPFAKTFSTSIKCIAISYPGRRGTHDLASFTGICELADRIWQTLAKAEQCPGELAFFGHSMGALVAFEVARRYEETGQPISALFVSACAAPGRIGYDYIPDSDRGLLDAVSDMTGANPEFLEDKEFADRILPTLRGLKAIANYECAPDATVSCPVFAFLGDTDEVATYDRVMGWSERTTAEFSARVFAGHHFYLNDHLRALVDDVEAKLWSCSSRS